MSSNLNVYFCKLDRRLSKSTHSKRCYSTRARQLGLIGTHASVFVHVLQSCRGFVRVHVDVRKVSHFERHRHDAQTHEHDVLGRGAVIPRSHVTLQRLFQLTSIVIVIAEFYVLHA